MDRHCADYDVLIAGGGLAGASLACALRGLPLRVGVIEAFPLASDHQPSFDARTVALSLASQRIFAALGLWPAMEADGVAAIEHIHVSDRGHAGVTHMHAAEQGVAALGYVVANRVLGRALLGGLDGAEGVDYLCPATLESLSFSHSRVTAGIDMDGEARALSARLLVAADGTHSRVRELCGIRSFELPYAQHAVIANVRCDRPHAGRAFERFTSQGPMALLPLADGVLPAGEDGHGDYALVWTQDEAAVATVCEWDDERFVAELQQAFGSRAGRFLACGPRHNYPLAMSQAREQVRPRLAVIGNAAHTLHPVAGQGFNLGLRDVAALAQVLAEQLAREPGGDIGALHVLRDYARWRRRDRLQTSFASHSLVRVFSRDLLPLAAARNAAMLALDILPPLKRWATRQAMGLGGKLPRLALGLPLQGAGSGAGHG